MTSRAIEIIVSITLFVSVVRWCSTVRQRRLRCCQANAFYRTMMRRLSHQRSIQTASFVADFSNDDGVGRNGGRFFGAPNGLESGHK